MGFLRCCQRTRKKQLYEAMCLFLPPSDLHRRKLEAVAALPTFLKQQVQTKKSAQVQFLLGMGGLELRQLLVLLFKVNVLTKNYVIRIQGP